MVQPVAKQKRVLDMFKPNCVKSMEKALDKLETVTDETIALVKKNGHNLEKAAITPKAVH